MDSNNFILLITYTITFFYFFCPYLISLIYIDFIFGSMDYVRNKLPAFMRKRQTSRHSPLQSNLGNQTVRRRNPTPYYSTNPIITTPILNRSMRSASMNQERMNRHRQPITNEQRSIIEQQRISTPIADEQRSAIMPSPVSYPPERSLVKGENTKNLFFSKKISTEANTDSHYRMVGLVSYSDTEGLNALRTFGTDIANLFGRKGFDMSVFDSLRISTLEKIEKMLEPNQKICSCRMEFDQGATGTNIFHHFYGTLFEKKK